MIEIVSSGDFPSRLAMITLISEHLPSCCDGACSGKPAITHFITSDIVQPSYKVIARVGQKCDRDEICREAFIIWKLGLNVQSLSARRGYITFSDIICHVVDYADALGYTNFTMVSSAGANVETIALAAQQKTFFVPYYMDKKYPKLSYKVIIERFCNCAASSHHNAKRYQETIRARIRTMHPEGALIISGVCEGRPPWKTYHVFIRLVDGRGRSKNRIVMITGPT
jgi:hypothetical protein